MSGKSLAGRKALVTGGARGIGAAIAQALARAGASIMIADILEETGRASAAAIAKEDVATGFVQLDVTDDAQWERAVAATVATLGGYDILINNAGIEITSLISEVKAEDARRMCDVNIVGTVLGMKHAFRAMRPGGPAGKGGAVVNIASVAATIAFPGIAVYSGTKSAVDRMTRVGAMEAGKLGFGVRVNCIYPGLIPTDMGMQLANDIVKVGLAADVNAAVGSVVEQTPLGRLAEVTRHRRCRGVPVLERGALHHRHRTAGRRRHGHVTTKPTTSISEERNERRRSPSSSMARPATPAGWSANIYASTTSPSSPPAAATRSSTPR